MNAAMGDASASYHVLPLGKKVGDAFKRREDLAPVRFGAEPWSIFDELTFENAQVIGSEILEAFVEGEYDEVKLIYNRFVNAGVQVTTTEDFLPVVAKKEATASSQGVDYLFEPSREEIVERIIPNSLKVQLYKGLLDSHAAEFGARMTAMHQATDNAGELLRDLKISYNKARQTSITTEILEIVAGSEALDG
jgi:F-type H+-transporting ATPase subunit gamma